MKNIVETAIDGENFTTLVKAVQAADLVDTLSGPGALTVFAPTDAAFSKVPSGVLDSVLKDKKELTKLLKYHVLSGKYMASDVKKLKSIETLQGQSVKVEVHRLFHRGVKIDDAQVIHPDIECTNGVIHVIDSVLMPK
ncbi:MAG TPA: fasciclin domain-containing protein [Candidatus Bathyarchaeia archaeon]|nr:fasciclin domain-containing protein [Candidatus Bathyarchaeia archaeon]